MTDTLVMRIDDPEYVLEFWDTTDTSLCPACPVCMKIHATWFTLHGKTWVDCCGMEREAIE
jgi:hypothetical protein